MHGNGARVPAPWPTPEFRVLETRQTIKSLVPATFPQLPRSKTWFLACCWFAIVYSKTYGFRWQTLVPWQNTGCRFVVFPIRSRNEKTYVFCFSRNYPATTVSQILSWLCPLATELPHATITILATVPWLSGTNISNFGFSFRFRFTLATSQPHSIIQWISRSCH